MEMAGYRRARYPQSVANLAPVSGEHLAQRVKHKASGDPDADVTGNIDKTGSGRNANQRTHNVYEGHSGDLLQTAISTYLNRVFAVRLAKS
jgi:hypothetical protein